MTEFPQLKPEHDDHQHTPLSDVVRVTILIWSMCILTCNYLGIFSQVVDPTFPASLLTGTATTYTPGLSKLARKKKEDKSVSVDTRSDTT